MTISPRCRPLAGRVPGWCTPLLALTLLPCLAATTHAAPSSVHGRVTSHFTGQPFAGTFVEVTDAQYHPLGGAVTEADGTYQWNGDCTSATCIAYVRRTYDSVPHDYASASFAAGAQNVTVDLQPHALAHLSGSVRGLAANAGYVGSIITFHYDEASSSWKDTGGVQQKGFQNIDADLPDGRYRICLGGMEIGLQRQCFDHQPEAGTWAQQTYTDVVLAEGEVRAGVDFDLVAGGSISGTLIDADKGAPLVGVPYNGHRQGVPQGIAVDLYDADGVRFDHAYTSTDSQGKYTLKGTPNGAFRVQLGASLTEFRDSLQVYPGIACAAPPCPIAAGTAVNTLDHGLVSGVDMPLHPAVTIHGTIFDEVTHQPIAGAVVAAWHLIPVGWEAPPTYEVYWTQSDALGKYVAYAPAEWSDGVYVAAGSTTLLSSIHLGTACPNGVENLCHEPSFSTTLPAGAVAVAVNSHTGDSITGINFALRQGGAFHGLVRDVGGAPLFASFTIFDAGGAQVASFFGYGFDTHGILAPYQSPALLPGTYYALASQWYEAGRCQAYSDRPCPTQGQSILDVAPTPITIALGENRSGIDFRLVVDGVFIDGFGG